MEKPGWLKVRLVSVPPTGSETILQTESENARFTLLQPGFFESSLDEPLWLTFDAAAMNVFDAGIARNLAL